jgi:hypothetical protein
LYEREEDLDQNDTTSTLTAEPKKPTRLRTWNNSPGYLRIIPILNQSNWWPPIDPPCLGRVSKFIWHQSDVHKFGVEDSQSSKRFRLTYRSPIYHVILAFVAHSFPKEAAPRFVHGLMSAIKEHVKAHSKLREAGEARVGQL